MLKPLENDWPATLFADQPQVLVSESLAMKQTRHPETGTVLALKTAESTLPLCCVPTSGSWQGRETLMLVLTRKVGERIVVPQCQLSMTVLELTPSRVRLGVSAPPGVAVHREEVHKRLSAKAAVSAGGVLMSARILIADPDRFLLSSYSRHLRDRGAVVSTAATALECVQRLRDSVPEVLVLEPAILWGGGDGVLAVMDEDEWLRPRFVMVVAHRRDRTRLYCLSSFPVDDYQARPLSANELAARIDTLLSSDTNRPVLSR